MPLHPVQSAILEVLATNPDISMSALYTLLKDKHGISVSLQSVYKSINRMTEEQMIIKVNGLFSLNLVWATYVLSYSNKVRETYFSDKLRSTNLDMEEGDRKDFFADSLLQLDPIYNSILLETTNQYDHKDYYSYYSHLYHPLAMSGTETRMWEGITSQGIDYYCLCGNKTFLDTRAMKTMGIVNLSHQVATDKPPFPKEGYLLDIYGDHIVECVLPDQLQRHFGVLFESINSIEQFDPEFFADIFKMRARCKLSVTKSSKKAAMLRNKIKEFF